MRRNVHFTRGPGEETHGLLGVFHRRRKNYDDQLEGELFHKRKGGRIRLEEQADKKGEKRGVNLYDLEAPKLNIGRIATKREEAFRGGPAASLC